MHKNKKPYTLIIAGKLIGFYRTQSEALQAAEKININRVRSSELPAVPDHIKIVYEQTGEPSRTVHEE